MNWRLIANLGGFQLGWLACVLGGNWIGLIAVSLLLGTHLYWLAWPGEWRWVAGLALIGLVVDGGLALAGGFHFAAADLPFGPLPLWLWLLWPLFGSTLQHGLAWLWLRPRLAMLSGTLGGPTSYYSGAQLADVALAPWLLITESLVWLALCYGLSQRLGKHRPALTTDTR